MHYKDPRASVGLKLMEVSLLPTKEAIVRRQKANFHWLLTDEN
jgi:hypothetical protein